MASYLHFGDILQAIGEAQVGVPVAGRHRRLQLSWCCLQRKCRLRQLDTNVSYDWWETLRNADMPTSSPNNITPPQLMPLDFNYLSGSITRSPDFVIYYQYYNHYTSRFLSCGGLSFAIFREMLLKGEGFEAPSGCREPHPFVHETKGYWCAILTDIPFDSSSTLTNEQHPTALSFLPIFVSYFSSTTRTHGRYHLDLSFCRSFSTGSQAERARGIRFRHLLFRFPSFITSHR